MSHDIFISYSTKDKIIADALLAALENNGLRCWAAPRDIPPGAEWGESITSAIDTCKIVLLIFSANSNSSKRVLDEIYYAISEEKIILPFRIENLDPSGAMRLHLSSRHWLDAYQPSWEAHITQLVKSAADAIGRPLTQPLEPVVTPRPLAQPVEPVVSPPPAVIIANKRKNKKFPWIWVGLATLLFAVVSLAILFGSSLWDKTELSPAQVQVSQIEPTNTPKPSPTRTPTEQYQTLVVTSTEDSGKGTLWNAIVYANYGDTITFDPQVFPPGRPATIFLSQQFPRITQGNITIDASNAGVILDGSSVPDGDFILIISSDHNTIMGMQFINAPGIALYIEGGAFNTIGGDRNSGSGPLGQGNLFSNNDSGIDILSGGGGNVIIGNIFGTDVTETEQIGNRSFAITLEDNLEYHNTPNIIGPNNVIVNNGTRDKSDANDITAGIKLDSWQLKTHITGNIIYNNDGPGIYYNFVDSVENTLSPPEILEFDPETGRVSGQACSGCTVEIFSTDTTDGKVFEGSTVAGQNGKFSFSKDQALTGPYLTATAYLAGYPTSEFSLPKGAP